MQGMNAQDLMNIIEWEFKHAPVIHNGAIRTTDQDVTDDADLFTTFTNGYIQNVCQRYLMGYLSSYNLWGEGGKSHQDLHFKASDVCQIHFSHLLLYFLFYFHSFHFLC